MKRVAAITFFTLLLLLCSCGLVLLLSEDNVNARTGQNTSTRLLLGQDTEITQFEDIIINLLNDYRIDNDLKVFERSNELDYTADLKLQNIIKENYWSHYNNEGDIMWGREYLIEQEFEFSYLGENLAKDFYNPNDMVVAWKESPTHNANILNPRFDSVGIACALQTNSTFICVNRFSN